MIDQQIAKKINDYYSYCKSKHYAHLKAAEKYKMLYNYTTAPIIILSSITTFLASYSINTSYFYLPIITAFLSGIITVGHALTSFLEFNIKHDTHLKVSNKYIDLAWTIENEFFLKYYNPNSDKEIDEKYISYLFESIHRDLTNIKAQEPCLPPSIADQSYLNNYYGLNDINSVLIPIDAVPFNPTFPQPPISKLRTNRVKDEIKTF